jgi:ATP-dependent Clp protease ATP-binding subunit ClpA
MMTKDLEKRLGSAVEHAKKSRHEFVTLEHILYSLLESELTQKILNGMNADIAKIRKSLKENIKKNCQEITAEQLGAYGGYDSWTPELTLACHRLFQRAAMQVQSAGRNQIHEGHLLVALFYEQNSFATYSLASQGISQFDLIQYISHGIGDEVSGTDPRALPGPGLDADGLPKDESKSSPLEAHCTNLNEMAKAGKLDPLIGRDDVLERTMQVLSRRTKNNPLLIGEPGVGKTAIAEGLASRIVEGKVPEVLKDKVI